MQRSDLLPISNPRTAEVECSSTFTPTWAWGWVGVTCRVFYRISRKQFFFEIIKNECSEKHTHTLHSNGRFWQLVSTSSSLCLLYQSFLNTIFNTMMWSSAHIQRTFSAVKEQLLVFIWRRLTCLFMFKTCFSCFIFNSFAFLIHNNRRFPVLFQTHSLTSFFIRVTT